MKGQVWQIQLREAPSLRFTLMIVTDPESEIDDVQFVRCLLLEVENHSGIPMPDEYTEGTTSLWNTNWFTRTHKEATRIA